VGTGLRLAEIVDMGVVGMCAIYEDTIKGYLPSQNTVHRQPGIDGDISERMSIYDGVRGCVFVGLPPDYAKVA